MCKQYFTLSQLRTHVSNGCPKDGASASGNNTLQNSFENANSPLEPSDHQSIILDDDDVPVLETLEVESDVVQASSL